MSGASHLPNDVGGQPAGEIDTADHGMEFWERQANALRRVARRAGLYEHDEIRRATEELGDDYHELGYFERSTLALRNLLVEKGILDETELERRIIELRARLEAGDDA